MTLPDSVHKISQKLNEIGAEGVVVGGYVRDKLAGTGESKDIDIEVYHINDLDLLKQTLSSITSVYEVGRSFGVLKMSFDGYDFDISLPRTESKTGRGHRGFSVTLESDLDFKQAARRRDFTINAMGYDISKQKLLDPFGGADDLADKILRVVDVKHFAEDPLRVLRAVQFAARFELTMDASSLTLCQKMVAEGMLDELPKERIFEELKKLLLQSRKPSIGFGLLDKMQALYPEIKALQNVAQNPHYHPEGDVYTHTMMSLDAMACLDVEEPKERLILMLAVLCHDFGKPATTQEIDGKIRSLGHEKAGLEPTRQFLERFSDEMKLVEAVLPLVEHHLKPSQFYADQSSDAAIRRLSTKVNMRRLIYVAKADFLGRTTPEALAGNYEAESWLLERCQALDVLHSRPKPFLGGKDLLALGLQPSPHFKEILDYAYDEQLKGSFYDRESALKWLSLTDVVKNIIN